MEFNLNLEIGVYKQIMMKQNNRNKLELTWVGKDEPLNLEPRILIENPKYSYGNKESGNMIIHGDNLLALKALEKDPNVKGKVKCIYIDPPYNTGSAFEHYDDNLDHSLWLTLMKERLVILANLLSGDGTIWISIDDNNQAYLNILCIEIFGKNNFLACLPTIMNLKGNQDQFGFAGTHEYTIVFAKNRNQVTFNQLSLSSEQINEDWALDEVGYYKKGATLKSTGEESLREDRPKMFYPILIKKNKVYSISRDEYNSLYCSVTKKFKDDILNGLMVKYSDYTMILPFKSKGEYGRWRWGFDTFYSNYSTEIIVNKGKNGFSLYKKQRPQIGDLPTTKPKSLFYKPQYSSGNGTKQIKDLFGYNAFPYPKPEDLIADIIHISTKSNDLVLDSFLGSGTTAAVAQKMGRRYVGIEMGDHAYSLCVERMKKVIDGTDQGGISKAENWKGGGGYKFYELASSLLNKDKFGQYIINKEYNADMLAHAMATHQGYTYSPDIECYWKQGFSSENDYIFTTTQFVTVEVIQTIVDKLGDDESLLICCTAYQSECTSFPQVTIKKIPQTILNTCTFDVEGYPLNIYDKEDATHEE